nr:hypothetical protein Iba_chr07aCG14700 [Ipomoea batatas]
MPKSFLSSRSRFMVEFPSIEWVALFMLEQWTCLLCYFISFRFSKQSSISRLSNNITPPLPLLSISSARFPRIPSFLRLGVFSRISHVQLEGEMVESVCIFVLPELFLTFFGGGGNTMEVLLCTCLSLRMLHISALTSRLFPEVLMSTSVCMFQRLLKVLGSSLRSVETARRGKDFGITAKCSVGISFSLEQEDKKERTCSLDGMFSDLRNSIIEERTQRRRGDLEVLMSTTLVFVLSLLHHVTCRMASSALPSPCSGSGSPRPSGSLGCRLIDRLDVVPPDPPPGSGDARLPEFLLKSFSDGFDLLSRIGNPGIVSRGLEVSDEAPPFVFVLLLLHHVLADGVLRLHHHVPDLVHHVLQDHLVVVVEPRVSRRLLHIRVVAIHVAHQILHLVLYHFRKRPHVFLHYII